MTEPQHPDNPWAKSPGPPPSYGQDFVPRWPDSPTRPGYRPRQWLRTPWLIALLTVLVSVPATLLAVFAVLAVTANSGGGNVGNGQPPPAAPSRPSTTHADIPAAFVGNWAGSIDADSFPGIRVIARIGITDKPVDGMVASASFTATGVICSGRFRLIESTGTVLRLQGSPPDQPECASSVNLRTEVELLPDGTLLYRESSELGRATGTLRRV